MAVVIKIEFLDNEYIMFSSVNPDGQVTRRMAASTFRPEDAIGTIVRELLDLSEAKNG